MYMQAKCNTNKHRNKKGFSLPELLISIGLMAFVATAAIGGIAVLSHVRETIDKRNKAEMIMIATVEYLRADLNDCQNPDTMDCIAKTGSYTFSTRYCKIFISDKTSQQNGATTALITAQPPSVKYWNTTSGIWVNIKYPVKPANQNGISAPAANRDYIIAQNVMEGTGMYSQIGNGGKIVYDEAEKLFTFTVDVVETGTGKIILSQEVKVCPDKLMPILPTTNNP